MKVIDAHTGLQVHIGQRIPLPIIPGVLVHPWMSRARMRNGLTDNYYVLTKIHPGIFHASADGWDVIDGKRRVLKNMPLIVRWMHPAYRWQHVAWVPS